MFSTPAQSLKAYEVSYEMNLVNLEWLKAPYIFFPSKR